MRRAIFAKIKVAATHATFGQCERLANVLLFYGRTISYRRKSFTVKLPLRKKFVSGATNYHNI